VDQIFALAKKEAYMSGIFWGASGLTGNLALLALLGYGESSREQQIMHTAHGQADILFPEERSRSAI
jgi:hypothetical protein